MQNYGELITIIVALYKPTVEELENIASYVRGCKECILMDDSEKDSEKDVLDFFEKKRIKNVVYCWNRENIGLCASVNRGMKFAYERGAEWILLMNGDSKIDNSMLNEFSDFIRKNSTEKISAIVPQYNYDRHPREKYCGSRPVLWANMSGMCINKKCIEDIGFFDERLFIDGLDVEWGIRAKKAKYEMYEIGMAIMEHHPAETKEFKIFGKIIFMYGWASPVRYYYQFRSNHYMIKKYKSAEALKWQCIKLIKALVLFENKKEYWRMYKKAISDCENDVWGKYSP